MEDSKELISAKRRIRRASKRYPNGTQFKSATGSPIIGIVKGGLKLKWIKLDKKSSEADIEEFSVTQGDIVSYGGTGCIYNASTNKWGKVTN